ncbi:RagB/SusD family nutrient uptake outer membrane protein [Flagellimonas sp.]|uniref:RagB/SusD family nutrient uptake outer membrane protein n=1 Tax=Flagellimonas sp. TaxID=2058762 RepID=UPI003B50E001
MKNIRTISLMALCLLIGLGTSCEDDLNLVPRDELSEATIFSTYNNVKTYAWSFYDFLEGHTRTAAWSATRDLDGDLMQNGGSTVSRAYLSQNMSVPASSGIWTDSYANIRKVNIMLDNIGDSGMTIEEIAHWRGVGLFFRAHEYFRLLSFYGGVPWVEETLTDFDTDILNGPRDSRDTVASNILRDLQEAVQTIKENGDGDNTVNADVARALLSRFGLFEGTWRKYHGLGDHERYLNASIDASETLISKYPNLHPSYDQVYNSENLEGVTGILLYKAYVIDELTHWVSTNTRSTNNKYDITRKGIDMFMTKNGLPIYNATNTQYQGDKDFHAEFRDRDDRLLIVTPPPYRVNGNGTQNWTPTGDVADEEYFDILTSITTGYPFKELPDRNWSGRVTGEVPNFTMLLPTQTGNGFRFWKVWNDHNDRVSSADISDFAIFRMGEVFLNYAEATFEMGQFTQSVADATVNKLRQRGNVANMMVGTIGADFDPNRDPSIDPILWEIRRERAIELLGDGFRREDLRRWRKMDYATEVKLGRWITQADYSQNIPIQGNAPVGYVQLIPIDPPTFPDHYYLFPLPSEELVLNPNLEQNPGW